MNKKDLKKQISPEEMEIAAREFWQEVELEAARLEITVDYYLMEFY